MSILVCFVFFLILILSGLAEQYYLSLSESKLEFSVRQEISSAKRLQWAITRRTPTLSDALWLAYFSSLLGFAITMYQSIVSLEGFEFSDWGLPHYIIVFIQLLIGAFAAVSLSNILPRFLQLLFKRKLVGRLIYTLPFSLYLIYALPAALTVAPVRWFLFKLGISKDASLLIPLKQVMSPEAAGAIDKIVEPEVTLFQNALDFEKVRVRDCMVPRNEMTVLELDSSIDELKSLFVQTHYSRILIYQETSDNVIGYVHSYDLFKNPDSIKKILLPISPVPEAMNAKDAFELFGKQRRSIAVVVDEFGGITGMVTVEDIIEEIFGEIDDEHDVSELHEERLPGHRFIFSGRLEIDYLNEKYGLDIPESENYDTLAGFVLDQLEDIPEANACLETDQFLITVSQVSEARIELIDLTVKAEN